MNDQVIGTYLAAICCVALIAVPIALAISAVIFQTACQWAGVKKPDFFPAMGISFLAGLAGNIASFPVSFGIGFGVGMLGFKQGWSETKIQIIAQALSFPPGILILGAVSAAIYMSLLKIEYIKGVIIYFYQLLISFIIALVLVVPIVAIALLTAR